MRFKDGKHLAMLPRGHGMILFYAALAGTGGLAFWRAGAVGRILKSFDGGRLMRSDHGGFGADARAYTFFVRVGALPIVAMGMWGIVSVLRG